MKGDVQHIISLKEKILQPVPMVDIKVNHENSLETVPPHL